MPVILLYCVLMAQTRILEVVIHLECKNDTNTPEMLKVWVLEVGPVLGQI